MGDGQAIVWLIPVTNHGDDPVTLPKRVFSIPVSEKSANAVCFMTNRRFAVGSDEGSVTVWEIEVPKADGQIGRVKHVRTIKVKGGKASGLSSAECCSPITSIAYDEDNDILYTGHWNSMIVMFRGNSGKSGANQLQVVRDVKDWILDMKCMMNGSLLVSSSSQPEITHFRKPKMQNPQTKTMETYNVSSVPSDPSSQPCWVQSVELLTHTKSPHIMTGDSWGRITQHYDDGGAAWQQKVHGGAITGLARADNHHICTASEDGTLKLWYRENHDNYTQVGQFFCQAPVSSLSVLYDIGYTSFMCGDKLGNVYFLEWKN